MNIMKKSLIFSILILAAALASAIRAEDPAPTPVSQPEELENSVDRLNREISLLKADTAEMGSRERKLMKKAASPARLELLAEIDTLHSHIAAAHASGAAASCAMADSALAGRRKLEADSAAVAALEAELRNLVEFRQRFLDNLAGPAVDGWLRRPYADVDVAELEGVLVGYDRFANDDRRVADARRRLFDHLTRARMWHKGNALLSEPYCREEVRSVAAELRALAPNAGAAGAASLNEIAESLDSYTRGLEAFRTLIARVRDVTADDATEAGARATARALMKTPEVEALVARIRINPWLSARYDEYVDTFAREPLKPNQVAALIESLRP